ncbi:RNA polymerase sigma factor SigF OS=Streptomyces tendae OX=1932 GN=F3L20_21375 PE=4 SV=1 [Streptomyces tendae]
MGLVKAVDHYDPAPGRASRRTPCRPSRARSERHFRDHMWTLHVRHRVQDLRNRVRHAAKELSQTSPGTAPPSPRSPSWRT